MKLTQSWVGYIDRSYEQIKAKVLKRLTQVAPEISDHSESNVLIQIISFFAGIAEGLHLYIDHMAREAFIGVARKFISVLRLSRLIDYTIKARWYASVDLVFTLTDSAGNLRYYPQGNILIPKNTLVRSQNGTMVRTLVDTYLLAGTPSVIVTAVQYDEVLDENLGTTNGTNNQRLTLPDNYVHNSITLRINNEFWTLASSPALMRPNSKQFVTFIDEDKLAHIQFGDGINGMVPPSGQTVYGTYKTSEGTSGNLPPNSYTELVTALQLPDNSMQFRVSHPGYSSGGQNFEGIEEIRRNAPRSLRTLERAVTYQDYKDVTNLQPGVGSSEVRYCCGKYVDIYITPSSKGVATSALVATTKDALQCKKMITTQVNVIASGLSRVWIKATIFIKPLHDVTKARIDIINALDANHGFEASEINKNIEISDIQTTIANVPSVDRVQLEEIRIEPYVKNLDNLTSLLNITFNGLPNPDYTTRAKYRIVFSAPNQFQIYKGQYLVSTIGVGQSYADSTTNFTLGAGTYTNGQSWEFNTFPSYPKIFPDSLIPITDYSLPVIDIGPEIDPNTPRTIFGELNIQGQTIQSSCLPPC